MCTVPSPWPEQRQRPHRILFSYESTINPHWILEEKEILTGKVLPRSDK